VVPSTLDESFGPTGLLNDLGLGLDPNPNSKISIEGIENA